MRGRHEREVIVVASCSKLTYVVIAVMSLCWNDRRIFGASLVCSI